MPNKKTTNGTTTTPLREKVTVDCSKHDRTHQSFKDECDINQVMERHRKTGIIRQTTQRPMYGDFSNVGDYQEALNIKLVADQMFAELPSKVRNRFENNPQLFLTFCEDPANEAEAIELGIAAKPAPEEPAPAVTEPVTPEGNPIIGGE